MKKTRLRSQQGAAIIMALFVTALVAAIATAMISRLQVDIRRTELLQNANTAYLYAQGSIIWATAALDESAAKQKENPIDRTPIQSPVDEENGVKIQSTIYDAQGSFNLNSLSESSAQPDFVRLIHLASPEIEEEQAKNIVKAIVDWITPSSNDQALAEYYVKQTPAYRAPHRPMVSISELRLVKGVTPALFETLSPLITALPKPTKLNINSVKMLTLMSLSPKITPEIAKKLTDRVKATPFLTMESLQNDELIKNNEIETNKLTISSNYFLVVTNVTVGQQLLTLDTMMVRGGGKETDKQAEKKEASPETESTKTKEQPTQSNTVILWQSKGTL